MDTLLGFLRNLRLFIQDFGDSLVANTRMRCNLFECCFRCHTALSLNANVRIQGESCMASKATLKQVAAHAGVSYQTVSKVLNKQAQVSKETEKRIHDSVRALGYRPNQIARNMRAKRSYMIGYSWAQTSPDQVNHILDQFLTSMVREAEAAGYHLLPFPFREGDG